MDKLKMEARPMDEVLKKVAAICPAAVQDNKIDFERLKQELAPELDDSAESYNFTWVGKRDAIIGAATPIRKTLLPCKEESKNWDTTKNLYIEGDNLDVLKLLQESYLGKVKMIYIDSPYNTGNDFIYCDDFADNCEEYLEKKGQCDVETHERLFKNDESNGRFHSNWCTMIYPRLKVARDLLSDDGVIFMSIDDHEFANLKKICDEVFGEDKFVGNLIWKTKTAAKGVPTKNMLVTNHDYILVYQGGAQFRFNGEDRDVSKFSNPDNDPRGPWKADNMKSTVSTNVFSIVDPKTGNVFTKNWAFSKESIEKMIAEDKIIWPSSPDGTPRQKRFMNEMTNDTTPLRSLIGEFQSETATNKLKELFDGEKLFDFPKHVDLMKLLVDQATQENSLVLDFFSGSATTAHAVMQLNAEDGGKRRFIMVQLPEECPEGSKYSTICEIGKERIRRAGDKIVAETGKSDLDIGFKVLKLADSNMKDVYYNPSEITQGNLLAKVDNIKEGRTELDLLYGVMLDLGLTLDLDVAEVKSGKTTYYNVDNGSLVACFADNIPESMIKEIAGLKPFRVVFKDSSFADAPSKINVTEIFKTMSPNTKITVL